MSIQYRGAGTSANAGGTGATSVTITLPAGQAAGDILFVALQTNNTTSQTFSQTGGTGTWTIDFSATLTTYSYMFAHRLMQAGDTAPTFGWQNSQVWSWSCGGFYSDTAQPLSLDTYATGDPKTNGSAATSITPNPATPTLGPNTASIILTSAGGNANGTSASHTYTPPPGWTFNDGDNAFMSYAARNATFAANAYQLRVTGTVTPGSQSLTDSSGDSFFFAVAHALVHEPVIPVAVLPPQLVMMRTEPISRTASRVIRR